MEIVPFEAKLFGQCLLSHVNNGSDWTTVICTILIPDQIAADTSACNAHTREVTSIPLITDHKGRVNCIYKEILFDNKKHFPQIRKQIPMIR